MDEWLAANGIDPSEVAPERPVLIVCDDIILYALNDPAGGYDECSTWCHVRPPEELGILEI
jgi:hypothetical protein